MLIKTTYLPAIIGYKPERIRVEIIDEDVVPVEIYGRDYKKAAQGAAESAGLELRVNSGIATCCGPFAYIWATSDTQGFPDIDYAIEMARS